MGVDLAVVIPTLDEEGTIEACLEAFGIEKDLAVVVSDGGSTDATRDLATRLGAHVVQGPKGRGPQLNRGAAALEAELESGLQQEQEAEPEGTQTAGEDPVCEEPEADPFPEPTVHFTLDGTASLVRSRFLHLQLDMQIREPVFETEAPAAEVSPPPLPATIADENETGLLPPRPAGFEFHGLAQRRQVRSGRMEYFDSPVLGVLAWITPIELEDAPER